MKKRILVVIAGLTVLPGIDLLSLVGERTV